MDKQKKGTITRRLLFSFFLFIIIFIFFGIFSYKSIHAVFDITRNLYNHPLVVSNTALQANASVVKMYRNLKELLRLENQNQLRDTIQSINIEEQRMYGFLDVIQNRILGEKGQKLEAETRALIDEWRPIRNEILNLILAGKREAVTGILIEQAFLHSAKIEEKLMGLSEYAKAKASSFISEADELRSRIILASFTFLLSVIILSFLIAFYTLKQTALAENLLNESEEKFRTISTSVKDALIVLNNDGNITFWNNSAEAIFGYTAEEVLGRELHPLMAPKKYHDLYKRAFSQFKTEGKGSAIGQTLELSAVRKDGSEFPMELSLASYRSNGKWFAVGTIRDISERKLAEQEKERLISDLKNALAEVKQLSGMLPICSVCKKIRDDKGYWNQIEVYIRDHSEAEFSHSICQECAKKLYPDLLDDDA